MHRQIRDFCKVWIHPEYSLLQGSNTGFGIANIPKTVWEKNPKKKALVNEIWHYIYIKKKSSVEDVSLGILHSCNLKERRRTQGLCYICHVILNGKATDGAKYYHWL